MDSMTEMAVRLARKGASDDVIALVMETMATRPAAPPQSDAQKAAPKRSEALASRPPGRVRLYFPLLAAIRQRVAASGAVESTVRKLCDQHRAEWMQSRQGLTASENARGFAAVVAYAVRHTDGVVGGVRFTFVNVYRGRGVRGGGGVSVYRVEAA